MPAGQMELAVSWGRLLGGHNGHLLPPLASGPLDPALKGTFITHSCAVLSPTDCGKPIWLQEVPTQGHSQLDPTLSSPPDTHILFSAGEQAWGSAMVSSCKAPGWP